MKSVFVRFTCAALGFVMIAGCAGSSGGGVATGPSTRSSARQVSESNLRQIAIASMMYAQEHKGAWPKSAEELKDMDLLPETMRSPVSGKPYVLTGKRGSSDMADPAVMAYDPGTPEGGHVLTTGGKIQWLGADALGRDRKGQGGLRRVSQSASPISRRSRK